MRILSRIRNKHPGASFTPGVATCLPAVIVQSSSFSEGPFTENAFVLRAIIIEIRSQFHVDIVVFGQNV
jgi:hypothetical protein